MSKATRGKQSNIPVPKCDYETDAGLCGVEAAVAVRATGMKSLTWLCTIHVRSWLTDHNLDLDDVL